MYHRAIRLVLNHATFTGKKCTKAKITDPLWAGKRCKSIILLLPNEIAIFIAERVHNSTINGRMRPLPTTSCSPLTRLSRCWIRGRHLSHYSRDCGRKKSKMFSEKYWCHLRGSFLRYLTSSQANEHRRTEKKYCSESHAWSAHAC